MEVATLDQVIDCIRSATKCAPKQFLGLRLEVNMATYYEIYGEDAVKGNASEGLTVAGVRIQPSLTRPTDPAVRLTVYPFNPNLKGGIE